MKRIFLALALIFSFAIAPVWANAVPVDFLLTSFLDNDAQQMAGGLIYTYAAGTTTPKATYTDAAKTTTAANPVVLDTAGRANVYADGLYKFVIKTSEGVTVATYDNLEFVSAVNPDTIVTTSLTVSSMTATLVNIKAGTIATATMDSSLITNSRLSNVAILADPTLASHPVNLSYFIATAAAQAAIEAAALAAHVASSTNPHGATLNQSTVDAGVVAAGIFSASTTLDLGGFFVPTATGVTLAGDINLETALSFASANTSSPGQHFSPAYKLRYVPGTGNFHLDLIGMDGALYKTITFSQDTGGYVDFNGMTLTNYLLGTSASGNPGTEAQTYYASAAVSVGMAPSGESIFVSATVPASFSAGWYDVDWQATFRNASDTLTNYGSFAARLYHNTAIKDNRYGFIGTNAGSVTEFQNTGGRVILYLSPSDTVAIKGLQGTMVANGVEGLGYALSFTFLGTTKRAY